MSSLSDSFDPVGNYNFICPYRHEVTHGLFLSVATLYCFHRYFRSTRAAWIFVAGLCLGLALLTKPEVFFAALLSAAVALASVAWIEKPSLRRLAHTSAGFVLSFALPFFVAFAWLSRAMPVEGAWNGMLGPWKASLSPAYLRSDFQMHVLGLAELGENLDALLRVSAGHLGLFLAGSVASLVVPNTALARRVAPAVLFVVTCAVLKLAAIPWPDVARPLPLVMGAATAILGTSVVRGRADPTSRKRNALRLAVAIFATALLGKMLFNVRLYHYGFALAMPATLLFVVALLHWVPRHLEWLGGDGRCFQAVVLASICVMVSVHLEASHDWWSRKSVRVGSGSDSFLADGRGVAVNAALAEIAERTAPGETLAVFPEGHMLNYLARRRSPNPYIDFMPTELGYFGENTLLDAFHTAPPDWIALVHKDTSEYGYRFFGRDYGRQFWSWIRAGYEGMTLIGAMPLQSDQFGILLLRRRSFQTPHQ